MPMLGRVFSRSYQLSLSNQGNQISLLTVLPLMFIMCVFHTLYSNSLPSLDPPPRNFWCVCLLSQQPPSSYFIHAVSDSKAFVLLAVMVAAMFLNPTVFDITHISFCPCLCLFVVVTNTACWPRNKRLGPVLCT